MTFTASRLDKKCGKSGIPDNAKCSKKTTSSSTKKKVAAAAALTAGAVAAGYLVSRNRRGIKALTGGSSPRALAGAVAPKALPGRAAPKGLLAAAVKPMGRASKPLGNAVKPSGPLGKTGRMRANTVAAMKEAESSIARSARLEIRRAGAIANAMYSSGEATGMATKMTARSLRLRTEAARRKYEPGYRKLRKKDSLWAAGFKP